MLAWIFSLVILHESTLSTQSDPRDLKRVLAWFDSIRALPIPHQIWLQCQIALIEGFTNALRHAHGDLPKEAPIDLHLVITHDTITIRIWDQGPGFDLMTSLERKLKMITPDSEGGRGLKIMNMVADQLTYEVQPDQRNCLIIRKHYCQESGEQNPPRLG